MPPHGAQGYPPYMGQHYPPHHQMMPMSVNPYQQHGPNSHPNSHPMCSHQPMAYPSSTMTVTPGERINSQHGHRQSENQQAHSRDDSLTSERRPSHQSQRSHTEKSSSVVNEQVKNRNAKKSYETSQQRQSAFQDVKEKSPMVRRRDSVDSRYERDSQNTSNYLVQTPFSNKNSKSKSGQ